MAQQFRAIVGGSVREEGWDESWRPAFCFIFLAIGDGVQAAGSAAAADIRIRQRKATVRLARAPENRSPPLLGCRACPQWVARQVGAQGTYA